MAAPVSWIPQAVLATAVSPFAYPWYPVWAALILAVVGVGVYWVAHRYRPRAKKAIPWVLAVVLVLTAWPAPAPDGHVGSEGMLVGTAEIPVTARSEGPVRVHGGDGHIEGSGQGAHLILECPEGCWFAVGGAVETGTIVDPRGDTVNLTGGPLLLYTQAHHCFTLPRFFSILTLEITYGDDPCSLRVLREFARAPAGSNGTVELEYESRVVA